MFSRSFPMVSLVAILMTFFSFGARAEDIGPYAVEKLEMDSDDTATAGASVQKYCEDYNANKMAVQKSLPCDFWGKGRFDTAAVKFCFEEKMYRSDCLEAVRNLKVSENVIALCRNFRDGDKGLNFRTECLQYFSHSNSVYDLGAAKFCVKEAGSNLDQAIPCLNAIRDRQVDAEALKKSCANRGGSFLGGWRETLTRCSDRAAWDAPLRTDALCSRKSKSTGGLTGAAAGTR